jgi:hypothetical protein
MKYTIPILFVLFIATNAQAEMTSKTLLGLMKTAQTSQSYGLAFGYFSGVIDGHQFYESIDAIGTHKGKPMKIKFCVPAKMEYLKLFKEFKHWAYTSGELKPKDAGYTSITIWGIKAYPCGEYY